MVVIIPTYECGTLKHSITRSLAATKVGNKLFPPETSHYAKSVHRTLVSVGVLDANTHYPDTSRVDRHLVSKIGIISVPKQRELVNMLFWWEEEIQRFKVLENEKMRLEQGLKNSDESGGEGAKEEVAARLKELELLRSVVPSQRRADGSVDVAVGERHGDDDNSARPPTYVP